MKTLHLPAIARELIESAATNPRAWRSAVRGLPPVPDRDALMSQVMQKIPVATERELHELARTYGLLTLRYWPFARDAIFVAIADPVYAEDMLRKNTKMLRMDLRKPVAAILLPASRALEYGPRKHTTPT